MTAGVAKILVRKDTGKYASNDPHAGMGIILSRRRVLTCAHVVNSSLRRDFEVLERPQVPIPITFPLLAGPMITRWGKITTWHPMGDLAESDIVVLELDADAPDAVGVAKFAPNGSLLALQTVRIFGVPAKQSEGNYVTGTYTGAVERYQGQIDGWPWSTAFVESGYSGAAVVDASDHVVGMTTARNRKHVIAYMILVDTLRSKLGEGIIPTTAHAMVARVPNMAPHPKADFVLRREESDRLMGLLLKGANAAVGITAALRGAGGYGKTQLARWLAHQEAIQDAFYDGILWVELGEHPKVHDLIEGVIKVLSGEAPGLPNATMAAAHLKEVIGDRRMLLVIDDVWNKSDLDTFLDGAPNLVRLITTRLDHVLPHGAAKVPVDAMKPAEAVDLLALGLTAAETEEARLARLAEVSAARPALLALAKRLGEWPLLLTLADPMLRDEVEGGATVANAIRYVEGVYDDEGLKGFDTGDEASRNSAARLSIGASLKRLDAAKGEVARFEDLAVFPEDEDIPAATVTRLWHATGGLDLAAGEVLLRTLRKWALLLSYDRAAGTVRLHDVMRKFLRDRVGPVGLARQAHALVAAYAGSTGLDLAGAERLYYYRHLPQHLHEAGARAKLDALLISAAWMQAKLSAVGARALIDDYHYARTKAQRLVGQTLELMGGVLVWDKRQLLPQLLGRMRVDLADAPAEVAAIASLLHDGRKLVNPPALAPRWARFTAPGGPEVRRFEGHSDSVNAVAFSTDGHHVVSGSNDGTLRVWEVARGVSRALEGHSGPVNAVAFSPDDRHVVSGSSDGTLRLWEVAGGASRALEGHAGPVNSVTFSTDGHHVVSGSNDGTLRVWEVARGASRALEGHSGPVNAAAFSNDGRHVVSGSADSTLRLWEVASGASRALGGHRGPVNAVAFSTDGRHVVSGSDDGTLCLWEVASAVCCPVAVTFQRMLAVAYSPDGRHVLSGSDDGRLRLWKAAGGAARTLKGRGDTSVNVNAVAFSHDGHHAVAGSADGTLSLWDVASGASRTLDGDGNRIEAVAFSHDGRHVVSGRTLRWWDVASGARARGKATTARGEPMPSPPTVAT
jgi:WD40 repeat protein